MRVLITGSRDWPDDGSVEQALFDVISTRLEDGRLEEDEEVIVVHGACPSGADLHAENTVEFWRQLGRSKARTEQYPADWKTYGNAAGPLRNREMVNLGADICLAFLGPCRKHPNSGHRSEGTRRTAEMAQAAGIEVIEIVRDY